MFNCTYICKGHYSITFRESCVLRVTAISENSLSVNYKKLNTFVLTTKDIKSHCHMLNFHS